MNKIKISCVSFLNSQPFVFGLKQYTGLSDLMELSLDVPSICAEKLLQNKVDIGLVPIAILPELADYSIISDYCIGANKKVLSVLLLSDYEIKNINTIILDKHSRTSNNLAKILAKHYWNIHPKFSFDNSKEIENMAKISIGDKALIEHKNYKYIYDLAEEWYNFKQKKFVFACWVANKKIPDSFLNTFNKALEFGVNNIDLMINKNFKYKLDNTNIKAYLENNIDYIFNREKQESMKLYLNLLETLK